MERFDGRHALQKFRIASGLRTETPVTADADPFDGNRSGENRPIQKSFRRQCGKLTGEIDRHHGFDAGLGQQPVLLPWRIKQMWRIRRQQTARMREKSHNYRISNKF